MIVSHLKRCWDRKCTRDSRKTRKITQSEYENSNFGAPIEFEQKYASMLLVVLMAMTYGSGLPVMYLIATIYFFVTYWTDKFLILRYYQKPNFLDEQLALRIVPWFKLGLVFHFVLGVMMFSNAKILPTASSENLDEQLSENESGSYTSSYSFGNVETPHMILFMTLILLIMLAYAIKKFFINNLS